MNISLNKVSRSVVRFASGLFAGFAAVCFTAQSLSAAPVVFTADYFGYYYQFGPSSVAATSGKPFIFSVEVEEDSATSVFSAGTLELPSGNTESMISDSSLPGWDAGVSKASYSDLVDVYPAGTYTLTLTSKAGGTTQVVFDATSAALPPAPVISNFSTLQSLDPTGAFLISWAAWSGGTDSDYIEVDIYDSLGQTVFYCDDTSASPLRGTATSITIPANVLAANKTYMLHVSFVKVLSYSTSGGVGDYPNAEKSVTCISDTLIQICTTSAVNIFAPLTHDGDWVVPGGATVDSFGWIDDSFYPWVYSIAADTIANGGKYTASGKGWMYVLPDGASLAGFYFYSYATDSWCWANFNWNGWVYDYKAGKWIDFTPAK